MTDGPLLALLFALFPRAFRERFGDDMRDLLADQLRGARARGGRAGVARLWLRTIPSLLRAVLLEHADALRARLARLPHDPTDAVRSDGMLKTLGSDVRLAARQLRKSPVFAAVAVLVIALGSGAVTTIFSAMNALLLRPLPGARDADALVRVERVRKDGTGGALGLSYPYYRFVRDRARSLDGAIAWSKLSLTVTADDRAGGTAVYGSLVSGNYFAVLGVRPALGRFFTPEEDATPLAHPVIVVSEPFWRTRLGADSGAVGRPITVNGRTFTLVGVAPAEFVGLDAPIRADAWAPLMMAGWLRPRTAFDSPGTSWLRLAGRLRDGATAESARRELAALAAGRAAEGAEPAEHRAFDDFRLAPLSGLPSDASGALGGFLALLLGAASLVLLIASVNVASMLSARAIARRREMAVRAALGAGRARLVRQLLTEILVLFALGALGGVALTAAATSALERMPLPSGAGAINLSLELSPDARVMAFALGVSLLTGLLFGLAPALQGVRRDVTTRLRAESAGTSARRSRLGNAFVVGQLALSLLLLVAAGLFLRALDRGARVDPGFSSAGVTVASFDSEAWGYDEARARAFMRALRDEVAAIPGVETVSYAERMPLTMNGTGDDIRVDGARGGDRPVPVRLSLVSDGYLATVRIPLVSGRALLRADDARAARVAVVNETLARRQWPDGDAVGRTFTYGGERVTVVGVARDAKYATLTETTPPMVYLPLAQHWRASQVLMARATAGADALAPAIRRAVQSLDPALPRPTVTTLARETAIVLLPQRVAAIVTGTLGGVGLLLASVGLYGVIAYTAGRRAREIGIRVALGARRGDVLGLVVGDGMRLAGVGVLLGVALAAAATRLMASLLFDVSPLDPATFGGTSLLLAGVALVASWIPARRAAAADPRAVLAAE